MADKKKKFKGIDTLTISGGTATDFFPTKLPSLKYKDWAKIKRGDFSGLENVRIKMKGGGTRQLTQNEVLILKTMPFLKRNEPNISFQNRVEQWEGITGIKIHGGKGLLNTDASPHGSHTKEARARRGEANIYWGNGKRFDDKPDWKDTLNDLTNAYNYTKVLNNRRVKEPVPINQKEIDKGAIDDATLIFKKNNPNQKVKEVKPAPQGNGLEITSNNGDTQVVRRTEINEKSNDTKLVKQAAISNPEWKDIEWAEKIATEKNIKNAKSFMNRARDIERAYGSLDWVAKQKYINNPISQLELEA